ncbi:MAG: phytanoyl-CoA dioxygenase family protein [Planctomycetaceae bacterium]
MIESHDFPVEEQAYDPTRLRVISHKGHQNPGAALIYYGHRDTWYSNPQAMITWWIPLHDVFPEETFQFFPGYFDQSVDNDSEIFDFDAWVAEGQEKRIGWQNKQTGRTAGYPQLRQEVSGETIDVVARKGEVLLFSGQHLHQTRKNETGKTRFSLDFRTVQLHDHAAKREPLNVDNRSTGSSLVQFVRPGARGSGVKNVP